MRESTREETRRRQRHQALVFVMSSAVDTSHTPLFGAQASIAKTATHHADGGTRFDTFAPAHLPATSPVSPSMSRRPKPLHSERLVNHLAPVALNLSPVEQVSIHSHSRSARQSERCLDRARRDNRKHHSSRNYAHAGCTMSTTNVAYRKNREEK